MKHERRRVRGLALQALYEVDSVGHPAESVIARHVDENRTLGPDGIEFLRRSVLGTLNEVPLLDRWIAACAPEWPVDELAVVDRNILRLALWEIRVAKETPVKVAINEAVELAKRYSSDSSPRFVNGVLGTLAAETAEP
jgi:N utilization substance protein B